MRKILVIGGMTGIGKTDIALKMATKYGKEIIIADSV
jgi:tRNA A37 N6-isopentenylltransferase MiaA